MSELEEIRRRVRNIWGAISSNQVIDKDVEGQAKRLLDYIDELRRAPSPSPAPGVVTEEMVETAARAYAEHQHGKGCPVWEEELPPMRAALASLSQPAKEREGGE
jgi:hypothetical protein